MLAGSTLQFALNVIVELTDQDLCHEPTIACYQSYTVRQSILGCGDEKSGGADVIATIDCRADRHREDLR